jgi:hypothetical protein
MISGLLKFRIDPLLSVELKKLIDGILVHYRDAEVTELNFGPSLDDKVIVDFVSEGSVHLVKEGPSYKICVLDRNQGLFSFGQSLDGSLVDAVLDDSMDARQINRLLSVPIEDFLRSKDDALNSISHKNLRKMESRARGLIQDKMAEKGLTPDSLLSYTQELVELEKELIHADDLPRIEKTLKHFVKTHIEKGKVQLLGREGIAKSSLQKSLLPLPRYLGTVAYLDFNWEDQDDFRFIKRFFFYSTLISFFSSQREIVDAFAGEKLWEGMLDAIPFPVVLLTESGEVCQHNVLFSKLNFPPLSCLKLKLREKILIHDIPYNIFRRSVNHMDEKKNLFVFFTESFFLKGDGNLTPSGQELGIISSSIAHELNNPIAGIQAALTLLMLDESLNEEAQLTLKEMKSGAGRCKQLVETFLGFSRANPGNISSQNLNMSPIGICYQQAQNLLRFRTVESGIRFSLDYSRHTSFSAQVNPSLLTMTFYLIMGELMTLYSHQLLVARSNQIEKVIKGEIVESSQEIQIQLHDLNISTLSLSKLIQNLLNIENFVLQVSDYSLRFIYSPSRNN